MATLSLKTKYLMLPGLKPIPKVSEIERLRSLLRKEYDDFVSFENSQELKDFLNLEKYLQSKDHKDLLSSVQSRLIEEKNKLDRYNILKKSKGIIEYFKFRQSPALASYLSFSESKELKDFLELEKYIQSGVFSDERMKLSQQKAGYDGKLRDFAGLKKSKGIRNYFAFRNSAVYKEFEETAASKDLMNLGELEKLVNSKDFVTLKNATDPKEFRSKPEHAKLEAYNALKKSPRLKKYFKLKESSKFKLFLEFARSKELAEYFSLEKLVGTKEFEEQKRTVEQQLAALLSKESDYLRQKKSKKMIDHFRFRDSAKLKNYLDFGKSAELKEYEDLDKYLQSSQYAGLMKDLGEKEKAENEKIAACETFRRTKKYTWYTTLKGSNRFDEITKWEVVFEDDFTGGGLDKGKWITRYYWGDKFLNDAYALPDDKAFPTDGKNVETGNSSLKIVTRREKITGKVWQPPMGFIPRGFDYTSGLVSTGKSYRGKYGRIEAKIRFRFVQGVHFNFWMAGDRMIPHVDILKFDSKKTLVEMAHHFMGQHTDNPEAIKNAFRGIDLTRDYFLYTLEWTKDRLVWKINGTVVNEQTRGIPQQEMYLVFSCAIKDKVADGDLPAAMEVDWVRWSMPKA